MMLFLEERMMRRDSYTVAMSRPSGDGTDCWDAGIRVNQRLDRNLADTTYKVGIERISCCDEKSIRI